MADTPAPNQLESTAEKVFPCRMCGETFNTQAEVDQHEKNCVNRKTSKA